MAVSRSFVYIELSPIVPDVCCMSFVQDLVPVRCGVKSVMCVEYVKSVLCAGFSLRYMWVLACAM